MGGTKTVKYIFLISITLFTLCILIDLNLI